MNRNDLIAEIARRIGYSKKDVSAAVDAYEDTIKDTLRSGDSILLHGFMKIERKTKKEHIGHGFGSGEPKVIPARDYVKIRPGANLSECVC